MAERTAQLESASAVNRRQETSQGLQWLQEVLALTRRWYIMLIRERLNLVFSLVQPAIWLVFFGASVERAVDEEVIGTSDYVGFMLPGIIAFTVVGNGVTGAMPLMWDKEQGYLDKLMSMPIARSSIIVSRFVFQLCLNSVQTAIVLAVALVMGVDFEGGPLGMLVILVAAGLLTLAFTSVFLALAYWVPGHGTFFAVTGFVTLPLLFMSNAFVPLEAMPGWMEVVARANPLTYAIEAMRIPVIEGWDVEVAWSLGVLAVAGVVCLVLATQQFGQRTGDRVN